MSNELTKIAVFKGKKVRKTIHNNEWWFSIIDVIEVLTDSENPRDYWYKMKIREKESSEVELSTICRQLKLKASDGKMRETDCSDVKGLFRIIQSIPSPKAEPFKQWLAKVGYERLQDIQDPARSVDRAREYWQQQGRSEKWIQQRMTGQETRNKLTDYWKDHGVKGDEYAILTNIIHQEWSDVTVKQHKAVKGLKSQNLRDHMNEAELLFTALAELTTRQIAERDDAVGMPQNAEAGRKGGRVAKRARVDFEIETGKKVVSGENFLPPPKTKKKLK